MTKLAIFAHYDKRNEIQDYVVEYLRGLKEVAHNIIFVSDSDVPQEELSKISNYVSHSIVGRHNEYDFGSYKRGYLWALDNDILKNYKELIFANDSCYAPLFPFSTMFEKMKDTKADYWGATINDNKHYKTDEIRNHVQSFFMVFKPQIFNSKHFENFMRSIKKQKEKKDGINKYEIGLSIYLQENGYNLDCYSEISKSVADSHLAQYKQLIKKERLPFLKRNIILKKEIQNVYPIGIKKIISKTKYNYNLIKKDYNKNKVEMSLWEEFYSIIKPYKRKIIRISTKNKNALLFNKIQIQW